MDSDAYLCRIPVRADTCQRANEGSSVSASEVRPRRALAAPSRTHRLLMLTQFGGSLSTERQQMQDVGWNVRAPDQSVVSVACRAGEMGS